jgi:Family of unknown function (DUF6328)
VTQEKTRQRTQGKRKYDEQDERDSADRNETEGQRLDRNIDEMLQELRVAQTGVQILFAFLLTIAFQQRFPQVTDFQRTVYVTTLLLVAAATGLLIAPVSFHRIVFRQRQKRTLVKATHRLATGGLVLLLFALVGAVLLILDVVLGTRQALLGAGGVALWFILFWYVIPLRARRQPPETYER